MTKLEMYPTGHGHYYFRFKSDFSGKMLESVLFASKAECLQAMRYLQKNCASDALYEYQTESNRRHWFLFKDNHGKPLASSELFSSKHALEIGLALVKNEAKRAPLLDLT